MLQIYKLNETEARDDADARFTELLHKHLNDLELSDSELDELYDLEIKFSDACDWEAPYKVSIKNN